MDLDKRAPIPCRRDESKLLQPLAQVWLVLNKPQALVQPELPKIRAVEPKSLQKQDWNLPKQPQSLGSSWNPPTDFHLSIDLDTVLSVPGLEEEKIWGKSCSQMSLWPCWACREAIWDGSVNDLHP